MILRKFGVIFVLIIEIKYSYCIVFCRYVFDYFNLMFCIYLIFSKYFFRFMCEFIDLFNILINCLVDVFVFCVYEENRDFFVRVLFNM